MKAKRIVKYIKKYYKNVSFSAVMINKKGTNIFSTNLSLTDVCPNLYCEVVIYPSKVLHLFISLGYLSDSYDALSELNNFNASSLWLKAYADRAKNNITVIQYTLPTFNNEKEAALNVAFALNQLESTVGIERLQKLLNYIHISK